MTRRDTRQKTKSFPVAADYFKPIRLSDQRLTELRSEAVLALAETLAECGVYQRSRGSYLAKDPVWRLHAEHEGLSEYKRAHATRPTASVCRVFGTVEGDYREMAAFYRSETRQQYFNVQKTLFPYAVDAAVLYTVPPHHRDHGSSVTYEGIKWTAYEPFALRFRMDSCHFESSGMGVDALGRPFAFRVVLPIQIRQVPDLFRSKRTVRAESRSVMIVMPSAHSGTLSELFMVTQNDFKSNVVPRCLHKRHLASLHSLGSFARGSGVADYTFGPSEWTRRARQDNCGVCARRFSLLWSRHRCSICEETTCRKCLVRSDVGSMSTQPGQSTASIAAAAIAVCTTCIKKLRKEHEPVLDTPMLGACVHSSWKRQLSHHLRMSEARTELSSYLFSESSNCIRKSSDPEWTTTPRVKSRKSRERFETDQTNRTASSSAASSVCDSDRMDCDTIIGDNDSECGDIEDSDIIEEEDGEALCQSSSSVLFTIDTREMKRVPLISESSSPEASPFEFTYINTSIQKQELLLKQLQHRTGSHPVRRNT